MISKVELILTTSIGSTSHFADALPVTEKTYFDLASLTKILSTTTLAMKRYDQGTLNLDQTLSVNPSFSSIRIKDLLTHASGLPAWKPFYEEMKSHFGVSLPYVSLVERKKKFDELLYRSVPENPPLSKVIYSDLGFLMLANLLSRDFKTDVESMWAAMKIEHLHFRPVLTDAFTARARSKQRGESIAATEFCPWRGLLVGQVHDDNAWSSGGIAGHAGSFGHLNDIKAWLHAIFLGPFLSRSTLEIFTREAVSISGIRRALGFDMPSEDGSGSTGFSFSRNTVGHLGYTGTSLWVDLDSGDYAILLTNRVHPSRADVRIRELRREFHRLVRA